MTAPVSESRSSLAAPDAPAPPAVDPGPAPMSLSRREIEVLRAWLVESSKEAAAAVLFVAPTTVSTHIARIRKKYADVGRPAPSKIALLVRALQDGYITVEDF